jgi:hypothetical protein
MISLGGLVSQKAFGKFEMGKVISNPFATAFAPQIKEGEDSDYEVSMAAKQLDDIIKSATELKAKMGENEFNVAAWIQDHISKSQNYINQANYGFDKNESVVNESNTAYETLMLIRNLEQTNKLLANDLKTSKALPNDKKENIKKSIVVNQGLINYYKENLKNLKNNESVNEVSPCWKGYKQVGMKDKGGKQVPNCVPNESIVKENILNEDLDALGLLIPALGAVIGGGLAQLYPYFTGRPNIYSNIKDWWNSKKDNSEMNKIANRIKNDPDVQEFLKKKNKSGWKEMLKKKLTGSELNYLNKIYRSRFNNESVNEAGGRIPKLYIKIEAVKNKIKALEDERKAKYGGDYAKKVNAETDPKKKTQLAQPIIAITKQIVSYQKNLIKMMDDEEKYYANMGKDDELDPNFS